MSETYVIAKDKSIRARVYARYCMAAYNRAKSCGKFEIKRVHRAFGLAFKELTTGETPDYQTTMKSCTCKDYQLGKRWNRGFCKHMIAKMIVRRAKDYMHDEHMKVIREKKAEEEKERKRLVAFQIELRRKALELG